MVRGSGAAVLTDPSVVLHELRRQHQPEADPAELQHVERLLASLMDRERRLVKLFSFGEVDEEVVREQMAEICRERACSRSGCGRYARSRLRATTRSMRIC